MKKTLSILIISFLAAACNDSSPWPGDCGTVYPFVKLTGLNAVFYDNETGGELSGETYRPQGDEIVFGITFDYRFANDSTRGDMIAAAADSSDCEESGTEGLTSELSAFTVTCDKTIGEIKAGEDLSPLLTIRANGTSSLTGIDTLEKWVEAVNRNSDPRALGLLYGGITATLEYDEWPVGDYALIVKLTNRSGETFQTNLPKITVSDDDDDEEGVQE